MYNTEPVIDKPVKYRNQPQAAEECAPSAAEKRKEFIQMKLPMNWLKDFVDCTDIVPREYAEVMTSTGSKVEGYALLGEDIENVMIGKILSVEKHPDAEKLQICMLDVGETEPLQIVTGAQNVFAGAMVPVAKAPAKLPGGVKIKAGKLRGVASNGMLCSIAELNLTLHDMPNAVEDGILILDEPCSPGDDIRDVLKLSDTVVEFEITPNRPDCLSVIGLARESAASFSRPLKLHQPTVRAAGGDSIEKYLSVKITDEKKCPRYTARVVKNVRIAPSPLWMRMRLRAAGVRPINNIVDITNYVMLEYGQPMHAFDYACLDGSRIQVRTAAEGERFVSLDDMVHTLDSSMLVIADENKAVALAGVMGGANSEIKDATQTVVFESANFQGASVRTTARRLGMRTESSARFEKGLDCENTWDAVERACELVELLGAGDVVSGVVDVYPEPKQVRTLSLEPEKINRFLGISLNEEEMREILIRLHFEVSGNTVRVPSFRDDVACMNDLAEEIIRIYGYNRIESTRFEAAVMEGVLSPKQAFREKMHELQCAMGLNEICTFTFISPKYYDRIGMPADHPQRNSVVIRNPLGEDTSIMRTTALPSMLEVLSRNSHFHAESVGLYEMAKVYLPRPEGTVTNDRGLEGSLPEERTCLVLGFYEMGDFYTMKGMVEKILEEAGVTGARYVAQNSSYVYHPGRCAYVFVGEKQLAAFGEAHPQVLRNYDIDSRVYLAEIDFDLLFEIANLKKEYRPLPKFPSLTRDLAFVCDKGLEVGALEEIMQKSAGKLLESIRLFDVYEGKQVGDGMKSVAFRLVFRASDRTLTDKEADDATQKVKDVLERETGAKLRG